MQNLSRFRTASSAKRRVAAIATSVAAAAVLLVAPGTASAQDFTAGSSGITDGFASVTSDAREGAWVTRNNFHNQVAALGPSGLPIQNAVDGAINGLFPGLIQEKTAAEDAARRAQAEAEAAVAARAAQEAAAREEAARFNRGSCPASADVCVDIDGGRTWLQEGGNVVYGAVPVSSGGIGQETPRGTFYINRKVKDEISHEFNNAPMPYAMYFTYNGHAFHQGNVATTSAGCIRLNQQDAIHYFNNVGIGDMVYIY